MFLTSTRSRIGLVVVEDSPFIARDLSRELERLGLSSYGLARTGARGEAALREGRPGVVLVEKQLGEDVRTRGVRREAEEKDVPVVQLQPYTDSRALRRFLARLPDRYFDAVAGEDILVADIVEAALRLHRRPWPEFGHPPSVLPFPKAPAEAVALVDLDDGAIRYVTPSVEGLLGSTSEECRGRSTGELVHEEDRGNARAGLAQLARGDRRRISGALRLRRGDGSWCRVHTLAALVTTRAGGHTALVYAAAVEKEEERGPDLTENRGLDGAGTGLISFSPEARLVEADRTLAELLGFDSVESAVGTSLRERLVEERAWSSLREDVVTQPVAGRELGVRRPDGETAWIRVNARLEHPEPFPEPVVLLSAVDVTEELRRLREHDSLEEVVENLRDAVVVVDRTGAITGWNDAARQMFGWSAEEARGREFSLVVPPERRDDVGQILDRVWAGERILSLEMERRDRDGGRLTVSASLVPVRDREGRVVAAASVERDLTHQKRLQASMERIAYEDPLTGLINRSVLVAQADRRLSLAERRDERVAVVFADLVGFKRINDTLGHAAGDEVLAAVARRLEAVARGSDIVSRVGGDEFVVFLGEVDGPEGARSAVERISSEVERPVEVGGGEITVGARFGIALFPDHGSSADELVVAADRAMNRTRGGEGRGAIALVEAETTMAMAGHPPLEMEIDRALAEGEFEIHYQPIRRLSDETGVGVEALLRWRHPERGILAAEQFVDTVEEVGRLQQVDLWVLEQTLTEGEMRRQADILGRPPDWISVNVAPSTLRNGEVRDRVDELLGGRGGDALKIVFEISERAAVLNPDLVIERLFELRRGGTTIALDNFGTGHSSLAYLGQMPVDQLKLDRMFVTELDGHGDPRRLVRSIVDLAHSLDLEVIVEGIEREDQYELAVAAGADFAQGYLVGRPTLRPAV